MTDDRPSEMLAAIQVARGTMESRRFPVPAPAAGQVLVRLRRASICGSDLHSLFDGLGYLNDLGDPGPGRPGHEVVGEIVESTVPEFAPGERVLAAKTAAFAEYGVANPSELVRLPAGESLDRLVMAQQLGVALFGLERFWPEARPAGRVATIIGAGPVGLFFLQLLKLRGFERVIVSDLAADRLALADALGADSTVLASEQSVVEATRACTDGAGADLVVEAAGYDDTRAQAISSVRTYGRVGLFGYPERSGAAPFPFAEAFWKAPITIELAIGSQQVPGLPHFHEAVRMISEKTVTVDYLLDRRYRLDEIQRAMDAARAREAIKILIEM